VLKEGSFKELYRGKYVYAFERELNGDKLISICNFSSKSQNIPRQIFGETVISNYSNATGKKLRPYEFVLIKPRAEAEND
jgi:hypothetical protein